jgi:hypothetical protein
MCQWLLFVRGSGRLNRETRNRLPALSIITTPDSHPWLETIALEIPSRSGIKKRPLGKPRWRLRRLPPVGILQAHLQVPPAVQVWTLQGQGVVSKVLATVRAEPAGIYLHAH